MRSRHSSALAAVALTGSLLAEAAFGDRTRSAAALDRSASGDTPVAAAARRPGDPVFDTRAASFLMADRDGGPCMQIEYGRADKALPPAGVPTCQINPATLWHFLRAVESLRGDAQPGLQDAGYVDVVVQRRVYWDRSEYRCLFSKRDAELLVSLLEDYPLAQKRVASTFGIPLRAAFQADSLEVRDPGYVQVRGRDATE